MRYKKSIALLRKYLLGKTSSEEERSIDEWYESVNDDLRFFNKGEIDSVKDQIYQKTLAGLDLQCLAPVIPFYKRTAFRAAALLVLGSTFFLLYKNKPASQAVAKTVPAKPAADVKPPAGNKAILTLGDGTIIQLDSSGNGTLAVQGKIKVVKQSDGVIAYQGNASGKVSFNTISVPRGSKPMKLLLADGSEVWLNVASSITYPTAFTGKERKVEITGEAYFEVAKNPLMPFIVKKANEDFQVAVLGTHFNINTYEDEFAMKVTLLEGAVDVSKGSVHKLLSPGQQAQISHSSVEINNGEDLEQVMAWKDGRFYFDGADIKMIMRQVEKWYDIQVSYQDNVSYSFVAKISRDVKASEFLRILELTDLVHFKIEGNIITVSK